MNIIFYLALAFVVYGICDLTGLNSVHTKHAAQPCAKKYARFRGISKLLLGIPWIIVYFLNIYFQWTTGQLILLLLVCSIPSIIYSVVIIQKFNAILSA